MSSTIFKVFAMRKKIFGFDLGIASIGWAAVEFNDEDFDEQTGELQEGKIIDCGVRCFPVAENPKDGSSLAMPRRQARLARRICRRKARRMEGLKKMFIAHGLAPDMQAINEIYAKQVSDREKKEKDVWNLRSLALSQKLSKEELVRVLTHLAKHRGFLSYRKAAEEKDKEGGRVLQAIKNNKDLLSDGKTLAQIIVARAGENGKKRNYTQRNAKGGDEPVYINSIPREEITEEAKLIFEKQKEYGIFTQKLYDDFCHIAFRHRPVGSVGNMVGFCRFEKGEKRAPKQAPTSELFVALTKINNMVLLEKDAIRRVDDNERAKILDLLKNTKTVKYSTLSKKVFNGKVQFKDIDYKKTTKKAKDGTVKEINPEDVVFYEMKGWHELKSKFGPDEWRVYEENLPLLDEVVKVIACEKNDANINKELEKINISAEHIAKFNKLTFDKFINLSLTALYKIVPYMEQGYLYNEACEKVGYDPKGTVDGLVDKKGITLSPIKEDKQTTVPVVNRTVAQFRKVYNEMVRCYGLPDQINIETGRELKKTFDERREINNKNKENEQERDDVRDELEKMGIRPNGNNILKLRLYKEQDGKCIYSGTPIDINRLDEVGYLDIDHIIPYSRSLDNSYTNKVLCLSSENRKKGNLTPYEYFTNFKSEEDWEIFKVRASSLHNKSKQTNLLNKNFKDRELEFRDRNANDNSYIARFVKQYCDEGIDFSSSACSISNRIQVRNGALTDYLRHQWGLKKDRNESDLHHAQDAVVIACATQSMVQRLSKLSSIFENKEEFRKRKAQELGHDKAEAWYKYIKTQMQEPWSGFRNDVLAALDNIFVSRPPRKNATGSAHAATVYKKAEKKGSVEIRGGMVEKENMFRLDVFEKDNKYYIVPIYIIDLISKTYKDIPQPIEYQNGYPIEIDESFTFIFSLHKDDFIEVKTKDETIKGYLNQYNAQSGQLYIGSSDNSCIYKINTSTVVEGDSVIIEVEEKEIKGVVEGYDEVNKKILLKSEDNDYYLDASLKLNKKGETTKNIQLMDGCIKLANEKKVSINVVTKIQKFQVGVLGDIHEIKKESRLPVNNIKSNKQRMAEKQKKKEK